MANTNMRKAAPGQRATFLKEVQLGRHEQGKDTASRAIPQAATVSNIPSPETLARALSLAAVARCQALDALKERGDTRLQALALARHNALESRRLGLLAGCCQ